MSWMILYLVTVKIEFISMEKACFHGEEPLINQQWDINHLCTVAMGIMADIHTSPSGGYLP